MFLWIPKVTWKSFLARVLAVFGSCLSSVFVAFCYLFHSVIQRWRLGVSSFLPTSSLVFWVFVAKSFVVQSRSDVLLSLSVVRSKGDVSRVFFVRFAISFIVWSKGDVWVFRVFCRRACWFFEGPTCFGTCLSSGLLICRAGGYFFLSLEGSVGNVSPVFRFRFRSVFGRFGLGFRCCLAFSQPLPTESHFCLCLRDGCSPASAVI